MRISAIGIVFLTVMLSSCCGTNSNTHTEDSVEIGTIAIPETEKRSVEEKIVLAEVGHPSIGPHKEVVGFLAGIGIDAAAALAKFIGSELASAMDSYANQFGASYSATLRGEDFTETQTGGPATRLFVFRRTLIGSKKDLLNLIPNPSPGTLHPSVDQPDKFDLDVVSIPFVMITSAGQQNLSCRCAVASKDDIAKQQGAFVWAPTPVYQGLKGRALGLDTIDKLSILITITLRSAYTNQTTGPNVGTWTGATISIKGSQLADLPSKGVKINGDWIPAPAGQAYSVTVTAAESSKMKEWLTKAAASLNKTADNQIDAWDKSEKQ